MIKARSDAAGDAPGDDVPVLLARIRELEEALAPFGLAADKADVLAEQNLRLGMGWLSDNTSTGFGIKFGHLRRARAVLRSRPA